MLNNNLTRKEKGFIKDYIETGNGTQSALKNYDIRGKNPEKIASVIAVENLAKPRIYNAIAEAIPDTLLAEKHLALLNKLDEQGNIDVQAVKAGLDMGYKIKGSYAPEKKDITTDGDKITTDTDLDMLAELMTNKLKEKKL